MNDQRKEGILHFRDVDWNEELPVLWKVRLGEIAEGQTWAAAISFTREWSVPRKAKDLVDRALYEKTVTMQLQIKPDVIMDCTINNIDNLGNYGALRIGSPDLGRAMMELIYPEPSAPPTEKPKQANWFEWP